MQTAGPAVPGTPSHKWNPRHSAYLQHLIPGKTKLMEQQADVGEVHAGKGAAWWLCLQGAAYWERCPCLVMF